MDMQITGDMAFTTLINDKCYYCEQTLFVAVFFYFHGLSPRILDINMRKSFLAYKNVCLLDNVTLLDSFPPHSE